MSNGGTEKQSQLPSSLRQRSEGAKLPTQAVPPVPRLTSGQGHRYSLYARQNVTPQSQEERARQKGGAFVKRSHGMVRDPAVVFELGLRFLKEPPQTNEESITPCLGISVPQVRGSALLPAISHRLDHV